MRSCSYTTDAIDELVTAAMAVPPAGVMVELHIYPKGPHGLALANEHTCNGNPAMIIPEVQGWIDLCCNWIQRTI